MAGTKKLIKQIKKGNSTSKGNRRVGRILKKQGAPRPQRKNKSAGGGSATRKNK